MGVYRTRIEGVVPLLQNRYWASDAPEKKSTRRTGSRDWRADAERSLYRSPDGTIYQPAEHIESAMAKAATNFTIPGKGKKSYKDMVRTALVIDPQAIPLSNQTWEIENHGVGRPVVVNRARVMRYRPEFFPWALEFEISILDDEFPSEVALEILQDAGKRNGIGDYRPKYGRFQVTKFEHVEP